MRPTSTVLIALAMVALASRLPAQLPNAELHSINPPVIPSGATTEITVTGVNLDELTGLAFSDPAIKATPVLLPASEYRPSPGQDGLRFAVTVPKYEQRKTCSVRTIGFFGQSTSRPLVTLPSGGQILSDRAGAAHHDRSTAPELGLEVQAHGTTDARQTDWWKISAKKGQRILVHCEAERIDSQADVALTLVDSAGRELERSRDAIDRDPMLDFTAPADGTYWVGVHDNFYNGGPNFPYILEASTRPWIDAVFPPAGGAGQTFAATLIGRNLPGGSLGENLLIEGKPVETLEVKITVPTAAPVVGFSPDNPARGVLPKFFWSYQNSNSVPIGISKLPLVTNSAALVPPFEMALAFDSKTPGPGTFRFTAVKGKSYWVEVVADRIAGKIDPYLLVEKVTIEKDGKETVKLVKEGDDTANQSGPTFNDGTRDVAVNFTSDQDGPYQITVINQFATNGPEKVCRVAVRESVPDFEIMALAERPYLENLQAFPATVFLRKDDTFPLTLILQRRDGFQSPVIVTAEGLPPGVNCPPVTLSEKENTARLVFAAAPDAAAWNGSIKLTAAAPPLTRPVHLGTLVRGVASTQTTRLRSRLDGDIPLSINPAEPTPARIEVGNDGKFSVTLGGKLDIPVKITSKSDWTGPLTITPLGLPGMKTPPTITIADKVNEGKLTIDFTSKPNVFTPTEGVWNFILKGTGVAKYKRNPKSVELAQAEKKHIEELVKKYTDLATKAKADAAKQKSEVDQVTKNLATASGEAKPGLEAALATAKTASEAAQKTAAAAEAKRLEAEKEKTAVTQRLDAVTKLAAAKDTKFAAWSQALTVEVKVAAKPPETPKK